MIWHYQAGRYGLIRIIDDYADRPTQTVYQIWSIEANGEPGEYMTEYASRDTAINKADLLDEFRHTMKECLQ